jgi:flagellar biosynthesis/type III secretory pathway chaperone
MVNRVEPLLEKQEKLLVRLAAFLKEEKEVLVREDGKRLMEIVGLKEKLQDDMEHMEADRKEKWGGLSLKEMAAKMDYEGGRKLMKKGKAIATILKEIRELQETNMMLTHQSVAYSQRLMDILQKTVRKSGITYGQNGAVATGQGIMASIDRSV